MDEQGDDVIRPWIIFGDQIVVPRYIQEKMVFSSIIAFFERNNNDILTFYLCRKEIELLYS